jgi:hypothetical protein
LYDFNLQVGDTLKGLLAYCNAVTSTVLSIDSILIDNSYRTRINFDTLDNCLWYSWIEGVGATTGLNSCFFGHFEMGTWMQCFSLNGNIGYTASCNPDTVPCGTLPVSIEDFLPGENGIHMFPNPADEKLYIQCNQRDEQFSFVLFDILGNELSHNQFSGIKFEMDISALPPGVYFMQINTETANVVVKKFSKF